MPSAGDVKAGEAFVELTARDKQALEACNRLEKRFRAVGSVIESVGKKMFAIGGAAVGALTGATLAWTAAASDAVDAAGRIGTTVEGWTGLAYAAQQSGAEVGELEGALQRMRKTVAEAAGGSKGAAAALAAVGLSAEQLAGLAPDRQFAALADALATIEDPGQRFAAATKLMGKGVAALGPLLAEGSAGIDRLIERGRHVGAVLDGEDAAAAEAFGDALADLKTSLLGTVYAVGSAVVPTLSGLVDWLTEAAAGLRTWLSENQALVAATFKVAAGVALVGGALLAVGVSLKSFAALLSFARPLLVAVKLGTIGLSAALGLIVSPVGLAGAAVTALLGVLLTCTSIGSRAMEWLGGKLKGVFSAVGEAWKGIVDAVAAGDLGLAARIALDFVKLQFFTATTWLKEIWLSAWNAIGDAMGSIITGFKNAWAEAIGFLEKKLYAFARRWGGVRGMMGAPTAAEVDGQTAATVAANNAARDAARNQRKATYDQGVAKLQEELATAKAELAQLVDKAAAERSGGLKKIIPKTAQRLAERSKVVEARSSELSATTAPGTFTAAAAFTLAAEGPLDRVATATEATAEGIDDLLKMAKDGGLAWAD